MSHAPVEEVLTRTERYKRLRNSYDRWQRRVLILGAMTDLFFGALLYFLPERTTTYFHLIVPPGGIGVVWVQLTGMLLMAMAAVYAYAALDPGRHLGVVVISGIGGRAWAVGFYLYYVILLDAPPMFLTFVGLDGALLLLHLWALGPDPWQRVKSSFACKDLYS